MNRVWFSGNIGKAPEVRTTQNGTMMATFSIAVRRRYKKDGETETDWFNCVCFGKQAEFVDKYLGKGSRINLVGRIENESYTNKEGQKVTATKIMVEEIEFAESKGDKPADKPNVDKDGFMDVADIPEDLPFL